MHKDKEEREARGRELGNPPCTLHNSREDNLPHSFSTTMATSITSSIYTNLKEKGKEK